MVGKARKLLLALIALLYVAGVPGSVLRETVVELIAPPLPAEVEGRDGTLDVVARTADDAHAVIAGARVRAFALLDGVAHAAGEGTTDAEGRVVLSRLPSAEHWIVAEAAGRARAAQMVVVVPGARKLDLELGVEHTLEVRAVDEKGAAVADAEIEARSSDPFPVGARTGRDGVAVVGRLGEGPYTLVVRAPGYEAVTKRRVLEGAPVVVTLSKQGALAVTVLRAGGEPAPDARVLVSSASLGPARVAMTGADGTVRIAGLDTGVYTLRATKGREVSAIELGVSVVRGEDAPVELRLGPGVTLAVRVVDAVTEDPVREARVTLAEEGLSPFPVEAVTDRAGRATLGPVAPGSSTVSARAEGYVPKAALRIDDPPPAELRIALVRGGTLVGRVRDSRGYAVDGASIRVVGTDLEGMPIDEDPQRTAFREAHFQSSLGGPRPLLPAGQLGVMPGPVPPIPHLGSPFGALSSPAPGGARTRATLGDEGWITARDGTFTATPVTPGRVRAYVRHPQYVEALSELVTLAPDKDAKVEIVLRRGGILEGKVVDTLGRSVSGVFVTALATRGSLERSTRTGTDGSFAFADVPEAMTLLVSREPDSGAVAARLEVNVREGAKERVEITIADPRAPLAVRITAEHGRGVEGAQVTVTSLAAGEALRRTVFTDRRGEAEVPGARGLPLRLEVHAPGRATRTVTSAADAREVLVVLEAAERLAGEVTDRRRQAIAGAELTLSTETGVRHARTDKDGAFTFADLTRGPARLRIRAKGYATTSLDVAVEARGGDRPTELRRVELAEEGVAVGTVVDDEGEPVAGARVAEDAVPTYLPSSGPLPAGMALTDAKGEFRLDGLAEGTRTIEAYAPELGRARVTARIDKGRVKSGLEIVIARGSAAGGASEVSATGGVAVTLGEGEHGEVVVVAVAEGSEAERAGLRAGDVLVEVAGAPVKSSADARTRLAGPVQDDVVLSVRRAERTIGVRVAREPVRR